MTAELIMMWIHSNYTCTSEPQEEVIISLQYASVLECISQFYIFMNYISKS